MTEHAANRADERVPGRDPEDVLRQIRAAIKADALAGEKTATGDWVCEMRLSDGALIYPVISEDAEIKTILLAGMEITTPTGRKTLYPELETVKVGGLDVTILPDLVPAPGPGAYRMSMAHYHSQMCCPGPSVSSTGIRKAALQSPHAFWKTWDGNPDRYPDKELSDALILGRAAHALILGDEVFDEHFIYVPKGSPNRPTATQIKAFNRDGFWSDAAAPGAAFWTEFDDRAAGRLLLKEDQVERIQRMAENLNNNPLCVEILKSDLIEISMIWQDEATGLWIKSRPDCIPSNGYDFGDLKTFSPKGADLRLSAIRAITDHGYPMQMALAGEGSERIFSVTAEKCGLVFVQSSEPHEVIPIEIDAEAMHWARVLNRSGMNRIAHGLATGDWPGIGVETVRYEYPPSMLHRFGEMQASGALPNI
jgi:hypothetical protein